MHQKFGIANKEIRTLNYRLETSTNEEVLNQLTSKNKELKRENEELLKEIKACEKIQNDQGKKLMDLTEESDFYTKIKNLSEELRMQKSRTKEWQDKFTSQKEANQKLKDKLRDYELKFKEDKSEVQSKPRKSSKNVAQDDPFWSAKMEDFEITNNKLKRKLDAVKKNLK